jgi:hypothetical protein
VTCKLAQSDATIPGDLACGFQINSNPALNLLHENVGSLAVPAGNTVTLLCQGMGDVPADLKCTAWVDERPVKRL